MKRSGFRNVLVLASLVAFVAASVMAVLPHAHPAGMTGHDCLICRAQSGHPSVEPRVSTAAPLQAVQGAVIGEASILRSQGAPRPFSSRAPPILA